MANPIIKILRGAGAPPTLEAGRIAIDQLNKNLVVGIDDGNGGTINEIVGGSGTFATKAFVSNAVTTATGNLGTMSTQNADAVAITGGSISGASVTNLPAPSADGDAATKKYTDDKVSALGSVFRYAGDVSQPTGFEGGIRENLYDLDTLPDTAAGAYYRVDVAGTYTAMVAKTQSFDAKVGDAFVQTTDGWQKLDNVDAEVLGTANEISVSGDENAGYTVALDPVFSGRVSTAETDIDDLQSKTQNIDLAGTTDGSTVINGDVRLAGGSPSFFVGDNGNETFKVVGADATVFGNFTVGFTSPILTVDMSGSINLGNGSGGDVSVSSAKLVGVDSGAGMPLIEGFIIDGGEY